MIPSYRVAHTGVIKENHGEILFENAAAIRLVKHGDKIFLYHYCNENSRDGLMQTAEVVMYRIGSIIARDLGYTAVCCDSYPFDD